MNRWLVPGAVAVTLALATVAAGLLPPQAAPPVEVPPDSSRVSLVCPSFSSATASVRVVAATSGAALRTAPLSNPGKEDEASGVAKLQNAAEPVRISGRRSDAFGGATLVTAGAGPERGLSASGCQAPRTDNWFTGVDLSGDTQAELHLANLDAAEAAVDVTVWSDQGRLAAPGSRGLIVPGHSQRTVSVGQLVRSGTPLTLLVRTSQGRVAAFLRERQWQGTTPLGAEWIAPTDAPAAEVVIAGIPQGVGRRELVVANPGERTAGVRIEVLGTSGRTAIAGQETMDLPAGTTRSVDLVAGLAEQAGSLRLESTQPITAALRLTRPDGTRPSDPAVTTASGALASTTLLPVPIPSGGKAVLILANPGTEDAAAAVAVSDDAGTPADPTQVTIPAGASALVPLDRARTAVVRVQTDSPGVRAAVVIKGEVDGVRGLATLGLGSGQVPRETSVLRFDPHVGG